MKSRIQSAADSAFHWKALLSSKYREPCSGLLTSTMVCDTWPTLMICRAFQSLAPSLSNWFYASHPAP